ncbi:hypothetical protein ABK040_009701 [Willaertia magna]
MSEDTLSPSPTSNTDNNNNETNSYIVDVVTSQGEEEEIHHDVCPVEESLTTSDKLSTILAVSTTSDKDNNNNNTNNNTTTILQVEEDMRKKGIIRHYIRCYYELWKTRLSSLVVFTTMGGLMIGTFLQSASANSFNEIIEIERDKLMKRTCNRPLPKNKISKLHALIQACITALLGTWILKKYTNNETAMLGLINLFLYVGVYTTTKPLHWINTWIGTLNGSIPPLMGVTAAMITTNNSLHNDYNLKLFITGIFMFGSMYLWQIVHFMAISYKCRSDYDLAGYKMLSISNPKAAANQSLLHSLALFPLCWSLPYFGVVPYWFSILSTPINYYFLLKPAIVFKRKINYDNATRLFFKSLSHILLLFTLSITAFKLQQNEGYVRWSNQLGEKCWSYVTSGYDYVKSLFQ